MRLRDRIFKLLPGRILQRKTGNDGTRKEATVKLLVCGGFGNGKTTLAERLIAGGADDAPKSDDTHRETVEVTYKPFRLKTRDYLIVDAPGHDRFTQTLTTGAAGSDIAVLLVDVNSGVTVQTKRHALIASLLGIPHVILAVNKMDTVDYSKRAFNDVVKSFERFADTFDFSSINAVPISALAGENVVERSTNMAWYEGPLLVDYLEAAELEHDPATRPLRIAVANEKGGASRVFSGTVASGVARPGDSIVVSVPARTAKVASIKLGEGDGSEARPGQSVTIELDEEVETDDGDLIAAVDNRPEVSDQFAAHVIWTSGNDLFPGRTYDLAIGNRKVGATVTEIKHKIDIETFEHLAAKTLEVNDIGFCNIAVSKPVAFDPFESNRETGSFVLVDHETGAPVAMGLIWFGLRRATNIHWQALDVNKSARSSLKGQKSAVLWFTGLSGSGKSTVANMVEKKLHAEGRHTYTLDGDNVRHGLNKDLGFTDADRVENIRRVAEVSRLFADAGEIVLVSFISPFRSERRLARDLMEDGEFIEVFVDTPIEVCKQRDPKGLYKKAEDGLIKNFTGIDSPYEAPESAEIVLDTTKGSPEVMADILIAELRQRGVIA
ncbi:MAG: adenylyl-sulfate kinase [Hyphomicrobiales bacterium]|nr:MAG: adenylyl-sulfate kinase [Hyphomicrobiales bacterium]